VQLVPAAFYAVARGLLLPVTVLLSFIILRTRATTGIMMNIVVICIGFVIGAGSKSGTGVSGSPLNLLRDPGFLLGVASTFTTALETIVVKHYGVKMTVYRAVYVTSLAGCVAFSALSFLSGGTTEFLELVASTRSPTPPLGLNGSPRSFSANIVIPILVSGSAYYLVSLAAVLQITVTSPVTHTISTAVRGVLQSLLAVMLLPNESLSLEAVISIIFILAGSAGYTWQKEQSRKEKEMQQVASGRRA
jgi:GDP-fucose transporter C1